MQNNEKHHSTHHSTLKKVRMLSKAQLAELNGVSVRTLGRRVMTDNLLKALGLTREAYCNTKVFTPEQTTFLKFYFKIDDEELG